MKVEHTSTPLRRCWRLLAKRYGLAGELDVRIRRRSRLWLKVLMFRSNREMRLFWRERMGNDLCRHTRGVTNAMGYECVSFRGGKESRPTMVVDPRYFCVIGLLVTDATPEVITHESVHAAFYYARRVKFRNLWMDSREVSEEHICYPTGRIAKAIFEWCAKHRWLSSGAPRKRALAKKVPKK